MDVLFGRVQSGVLRLQHNVHAQLQQLAVGTPPPAASPSCALQSMFVRAASPLEASSRPQSVPVSPASSTDSDTSEVLTDMDGVSLLIASFLDGETLARVQSVSRAWRKFVLQHRDELYSRLLSDFPTVVPSSSAFKTYLFSLRHALDVELQHSLTVQPVHEALEQYCTEVEPMNHGFVAMFCDIVEFRDPKIARFVAWKRQSALSMVLVATPEHVKAFRRRSTYVGPITFVPVDNPNWPDFQSPAVDFPGFLGYAFDHATMVPGYESLRETVVKSILKELMLFDSEEAATAYGLAIGSTPFAAVVNDEATTELLSARGHSQLTFSSPLRRRLTHLSVNDRIQHLRARIEAVDCCILATTADAFA